MPWQCVALLKADPENEEAAIMLAELMFHKVMLNTISCLMLLHTRVGLLVTCFRKCVEGCLQLCSQLGADILQSCSEVVQADVAVLAIVCVGDATCLKLWTQLLNTVESVLY